MFFPKENPQGGRQEPAGREQGFPRAQRAGGGSYSTVPVSRRRSSSPKGSLEKSRL